MGKNYLIILSTRPFGTLMLSQGRKKYYFKVFKEGEIYKELKHNFPKMRQKESIRKLYSRWAPIYELAHHLQTIWTDSKYRNIVANIVDIQPGERVLDVSTGTGLTGLAALAKQPGAYVVGIDFTPAMLYPAQDNIKKNSAEGRFGIVTGDMENLPFANNSFDVIISTYGIGGIEDREKAFAEIVRVAKPDARIAAIEMISPPLEKGLKRMAHKYLVEPWIKRFWGFRDIELEKPFEKHGINIERTEYYDEFVLGSSKLAYAIVRK